MPRNIVTHLFDRSGIHDRICCFGEHEGIDRAKVMIEIQKEVLLVLDEALSLGGRTERFTSETLLLGAISELDSMAIVSVLTMLEERFDIEVDDDELDGSVFETVGGLVDFVRQKLT